MNQVVNPIASSLLLLRKNGSSGPPPTIQATSISVTGKSDTTLSISWVRGNGEKCLVVVKAGSAVSSNPSNNNTYNASAAFGSGSQIGTGNYVVYKGTGTTLTITGLTADTTYHIRIYEFNGIDGAEKYFTDTATGNPTSSTTFITEYQTLIARATTLTYNRPSLAQQLKQNQLLKRYKDGGILALTDVMYVTWNDIAGNFWKLNWKTPASHECTEPGGAVTKTSNVGINGNGTSTYADCNFTPSTQATQLNALTGGAQAMYLHTVPTTGQRLCGARNVSGTNPYLSMGYLGAANFEYRTLDDSAGGNYTGGTPNGSFLYAEATPAEYKLWKNGVQVQQLAAVNILGLPAQSLRIGSAAGNGGGFCNGVISIQWWGAPLSNAQKLEQTNAWTEYIS